jgi:hypothetical protein
MHSTVTPERGWGYPATAPSMGHTIRAALVAVIVGAAGGAAVVCTLTGPEDRQISTARLAGPSFLEDSRPTSATAANQPVEAAHLVLPTPHTAVASAPTTMDILPSHVPDPPVVVSPLKEPGAEGAPTVLPTASQGGDPIKLGENEKARAPLPSKANKPRVTFRYRPSRYASEPTFFRTW